MAMKTLSFVSRAALPELSRGREGSESVTVHGNGQISLSGKATKALSSEEGKIAVAFDKGTRTLTVLFATDTVKKQYKLKDETLFAYKINKKSKTGFFAGSALLQDPNGDVFGDKKYDYKASGNQSFEAEVEDGIVSIKLPSGKLPPKVVVPRKKKDKGPVSPVAQMPAPTPKADEDELETLEETA